MKPRSGLYRCTKESGSSKGNDRRVFSSGVTRRSTSWVLLSMEKLYHKWHISLNTLVFKSFLSGFMKQLPTGSYVFLLDNATYHKSSTIRKYLNTFSNNIKVEFFPPYSPELNPTESCWRTIRTKVTNSTYFPTVENMQMQINQFLAGQTFNFNTSNYLCP